MVDLVTDLNLKERKWGFIPFDVFLCGCFIFGAYLGCWSLQLYYHRNMSMCVQTSKSLFLPEN